MSRLALRNQHKVKALYVLLVGPLIYLFPGFVSPLSLHIGASPSVGVRLCAPVGCTYGRWLLLNASPPRSMLLPYLHTPCLLIWHHAFTMRFLLLSCLTPPLSSSLPPLYLHPYQVVVFFSSCDSVDFHHSLLNSLVHALPSPSDSTPSPPSPSTHLLSPSSPILKLHGNMAQVDRSAAFKAYRSAPSAVLLCTDVAARGLDFPSVSAIVQFDSPGDVQDYVHR